MKKTTIKDIAKKAGVSCVTVSKVINDGGNISFKTAHRIKNIIKKTGYIPSPWAVNLVRGRTNTVAVVAPGLSRGFPSEVFEGIQGVLNKSKMFMSVFSTGASGKGEKNTYDRIINGKMADVAIVLSNCPDDMVIKKFNRYKIGLVLIESKKKGAYSVKVDNVAGAEKAVRYLLSKKKKNIGVVIGDVKNIESQRERMRGYKKALKNYGIPFKKELVYVAKQHLYEDGVKAAEVFKKIKADAVFSAAGDYVAYGILEGVGNRNINVVGYDDLKTSSLMGLTTIRQPMADMGAAAFKMAEAFIEGENSKIEDIIYDPELIIRKSA